MLSSLVSPPSLTRAIGFHRRVIPAILSLFGIGYTVWEALLTDGNPLTSRQVLAAFALLGVIGPLFAFLTLTWAQHVAASFEQTDQERERQHRHLAALNTISESVNQSLDLDTVLNRAIERVLDVMDVESGDVKLIEGGRLVLHASRGVSPAFIQREQIVSLGQCACGQAAQRGELMIQNTDTAEFGKTACGCEQFSSTLSVPVRAAERIVGVIHVASRERRHFDSSDLVLLSAIGNQVGSAIDKARLHAQLKALNQELEARVADRTGELLAAQEELVEKADALHQVLVEERRVEEKTRARIAHDLHDGVQQLLIGALFETQAARDALTTNPKAAADRIAAAQDLFKRIEVEMRHAIYSLRPVVLDAHGLGPALREAVASFERVSRVPCDLQIEGVPRRLDPESEVAAFRICQEALNNVEAHAQAQSVHVRLQFGRELCIEIADDGRGFDVAEITQQASTQLGLIGMRERAASAGGMLDISSRIGEGTRVLLTLPVSHSQPAGQSA